MASSGTRSRATAGRLLAGCDDEQREAITTADKKLCVLAAAGSGKTRVLTRRIAWRVNEESASAPYVMTLTFTRKAAAELRRRLSSLGLSEPAHAGTFHAIALGELRRLAAERGRPAPVVLASKARLLANAAGEGLAHERARLADLALEIEWAKARCVSIRDYARAAAASGRQSPVEPGVVTEVWTRYEREKQRRGVLDFDDLLLRCAVELEKDSEFAASARWRFRHIFVDEYQDVNPAQVRLLDGWLGNNDDLCVVGDPDQAIYAWNGSDSRALVEFPERHPDSRVIRLTRNYRSSEAVLAVASSILNAPASDPSSPADTARPEDEPDARLGRSLVSARPISVGRPQSIVAYETDVDEARGVVAALKKGRQPGAPWSSLAVLARSNAQLFLFERELRAAGVPFRSGGGRDFLARPTVRDALESLTSGPNSISVRGWLEDITASALSEPDLTSEDELEGHAGRAVDEDLLELGRLALEFLQSDANPSPRGFVTWVEASLRSDPPRQTGDAVDLVTFHRSKGLEWRVVFVTGLEDGLVPIAYARSPEALAEERRLLYVACTRAIDDLRCSWARQRSFGGRRSARTPSPYLASIEAAHRELARLAEVTPDDVRTARRAVRALLAGRERTPREP